MPSACSKMLAVGSWQHPPAAPETHPQGAKQLNATLQVYHALQEVAVDATSTARMPHITCEGAEHLPPQLLLLRLL
jgi:hypothetical protein